MIGKMTWKVLLNSNILQFPLVSLLMNRLKTDQEEGWRDKKQGSTSSAGTPAFSSRRHGSAGPRSRVFKSDRWPHCWHWYRKNGLTSTLPPGTPSVPALKGELSLWFRGKRRPRSSKKDHGSSNPALQVKSKFTKEIRATKPTWAAHYCLAQVNWERRCGGRKRLPHSQLRKTLKPGLGLEQRLKCKYISTLTWTRI